MFSNFLPVTNLTTLKGSAIAAKASNDVRHSEAFLPTAPILENIFSCHSEALAEESQNGLSDFAQDDKNNLTVTSYSPITLFPYYRKKKSAFTLAEVLITLGVIGVVAALVMPGVIRNYQRRELQTSLMHAESIIQEALKQTAIDYGYVGYEDFALSFNTGQELSAILPEINKTFLSHLKVIKTGNLPLSSRTKTVTYSDFLGTFKKPYAYLNIAGGSSVLSNGMLVKLVNHSYAGGPARLVVKIDTNGFNKGPNKEGYDMFFIASPKVFRYGCDPLGYGSEILNGCSYYARANVSPYGKGDYWNDFLWKSREELQKIRNGE